MGPHSGKTDGDHTRLTFPELGDWVSALRAKANKSFSLPKPSSDVIYLT